MYLLDTNACIRILNDSSEGLVRRLRQHPPAELRMCSVVKAELYRGARRSTRPAANLRLLERFFAPFASLAFDDRCAERYGAIRQELERTGAPIGSNDLMIAAIAVRNDLALVTHNVREFSRVVGLRLEDWEESPAE